MNCKKFTEGNEGNEVENTSSLPSVKSRNFATVRPIRPEDAEAVRAAAAEDGHQLVAPTHVVERDGEIIGALSVGVVPLVLAWGHSTKSRTRDAVHTVSVIENLLALASPAGTVVAIPSVAECPFAGTLQALGYSQHGTVTLNLKKVN